MKMISKNIKMFFLKDSSSKLIGLLTILILLWLVLYLIPELLVSLFNTVLGCTILLITVVLVGLNNYNDYRYGIMLGISLIIMYRFVQLSTVSEKEGFVWSPDSTTNFLQLQNTINKNVIFDPIQIQQQASQEEVDYFLQNGKWPWSQEVQDLYSKMLDKNPFVRTYSKDAIIHARTIYNQNAILQIISWQNKEGNFLINGVEVNDNSKNPLEDLPSGFGNFGYSSGLIIHRNNPIIRCKVNPEGENMTLEKRTYTGKDGITGLQTKDISDVDYNDLEQIIPGFKFTNGPCNPCSALNSPPDYSCPFTLKLKNKSSATSSVWNYLWSQ
jgi:serine/threonine protein kinase